MTIALPARSRPVHRVANTTLVVIVALVAVLVGLIYIAKFTTLPDWQSCGVAGTDKRNTCRQMEK